RRYQVPLTSVHLGLTVYIDEPRAWAEGHVASILEAWLRSIELGERHLFYKSSLLPSWRRLDDGFDLVRDLRAELWPRLRNEFYLDFTDHPHDPTVRFYYREASASGS